MILYMVFKRRELTQNLYRLVTVQKLRQSTLERMVHFFLLPNFNHLFLIERFL